MIASIEALLEDIDWLAADTGELRSNEAARQVLALQARVATACEKVMQAHAGALLGSALCRFPWVSSFRIRLSVSMEYDDNVACFPFVELTLTDVVVDVGYPAPTGDDVAELLHACLEGDRDVLYEAFGAELDGHDHLVDVDLQVDRQVLRRALVCETISGRVVYAALAAANGMT
jgi:hypothetical protein